MTKDEQLEQMAKDKAKEIFDTFFEIIFDIDFAVNVKKDGARYDSAKLSALTTVNLLIEEQDMWQNGESQPIKYWQKVRSYLAEL